jgi:hypothetical protein
VVWFSLVPNGKYALTKLRERVDVAAIHTVPVRMVAGRSAMYELVFEPGQHAVVAKNYGLPQAE